MRTTPSLPRPTPSATPTRFSTPDGDDDAADDDAVDADISLTASFATTTHDCRDLSPDLLSTTTEDLGIGGVGGVGSGGVEFSPSNLERQMTNQLNFLSAADEGLRHLEALGRTRAVALAQQETVSMAQVLKAQRLEQQRQMELLQAKTAKEKEIAERALAEAKANYRRLEAGKETRWRVVD